MASNLRGEVEELYYLEAELLDDRRFDEWVDLFTDDARYWIPARQTTTTGELADELLGSRRVLPERARAHGFAFGYPNFEEAVRREIG